MNGMKTAGLVVLTVLLVAAGAAGGAWWGAKNTNIDSGQRVAEERAAEIAEGTMSVLQIDGESEGLLFAGRAKPGSLTRWEGQVRKNGHLHNLNTPNTILTYSPIDVEQPANVELAGEALVAPQHFLDVCIRKPVPLDYPYTREPEVAGMVKALMKVEIWPPGAGAYVHVGYRLIREKQPPENGPPEEFAVYFEDWVVFADAPLAESEIRTTVVPLPSSVDTLKAFLVWVANEHSGHTGDDEPVCGQNVRCFDKTLAHLIQERVVDDQMGLDAPPPPPSSPPEDTGKIQVPPSCSCPPFAPCPPWPIPT